MINTNLDKYGATRIPQFDSSILDTFSFYKKYLSGLPTNARVCEIGPGNGTFAIFIERTFGIPQVNFFLTDLSSSTVELLNKQVETRSYNNILADSIEYFSGLENNSLDLIVMRHVMEHMEKSYINMLLPIMEMKLKHGGRILVEVPNVGSIPFGFYAAFGDYSHYTQFTFETLYEAFLWSMKGSFSMKTYNIWPFMTWGGGIFAIIKRLIAYCIQWFSICITFFFFRNNGDRTGTGQVYTQFILAIITKL